jgi:hypothetical protein
MAEKYSYSISSSTLNGIIDSDRLIQEIHNSTITIDVCDIQTNNDTLDIYFKIAISNDELITFTEILASHSGQPLTQPVQDVNLASSAVLLSTKDVSFADRTGHDYYKKGFCEKALAGQINDFYLKFSSTMLLGGGGYWIGTQAAIGDYVEISIVDKDNVLGYGAGLVVGTFVATDYVWAEKKWEVITDDVKTVPSFLYFRIRYYSVGTSDVDLIGWYNLRKG